MTRPPEFDGLTQSYYWCSPDGLDFSCTPFMESDGYDYDYDNNDDYEFDTHPELTDLITSRKHFASRDPFRSDGNPRGKFLRKPLPWPARKLSRLEWYEQEAEEYRNRLWQWEVEQKQKHQGNHDHSSMPECIPDDLEDSVTSPTQEKTANNEPRTRHDRRGPRTNINTTKKMNKKKARKQKRRAQKARDKSKPRLDKPHYLLALDAMHRKKGCQTIWVGCPICNKIMAEWDGIIKNKSRDLATRRQDGLWEAKHECFALDIFNDDRSELRGCDCGLCWLGSPIDPDHDRAHVEMRDVVDYVDSLGWETFRMRYVDHIGRGTRRANQPQDLYPVQEEGEVVVQVPIIHYSIPERTEDTDSINLSNDEDADAVSEEWDLLDTDSLERCSMHGDARPDTVKSGKDTSMWSTQMNSTQGSGWTTNWFLSRWFG